MEFIGKALEKVELVGKIGAAAVEWLVVSERLNEEVQALKEKVDKLSDREDDVRTALKAQEHQSGKKRKREVENWLRNVQRKKTEVEQRVQAATESRYMMRWRLRWLVQKDIKEVTELFDQGSFNRGLWIDAGSPKVELIVPSKILPSAKQKIDKIWECLINDQTLLIGVIGMGGVGKSTIVAYIYNRLISNSSFDDVFWVTVRRQSSIYNLQKSISKAAGLDFSGEDDERKRAAMLFKYLENRKFVLILDDVWDIFQPREVGIPLGFNQGKLVLTTRMFNVCREMQCQEEIEIRRLSSGESWELFLDELGSAMVLSPRLEECARSVARECAGVPLAIVTVARSMRGEEKISEWRHALNELQDPTMDHMKRRNELFKQLKFSYDHLGDESLQQCLLYCALFPEDWEIERDELIAYWIGEGLIAKLKNRQAEFDKGNVIINCLADACLLETSKHMIGKSFVKMNDAVRDMALAIASVSPLFMVKAGVQLTEFPREWPENLDRVSLMRNYLEGHHSALSPECPELKTLLLQYNENLNRLPHSFFINFQSLHVLNLSGSRIQSLPNTVIYLENLSVLILRHCRLLKYIPPLGTLKNLQELDLGFTGLRKLPNGMKRLAELRVLDLSWTSLQTLFLNKVLESLSLLQSLRLEGCREVQPGAISQLKKLETLHINFSDILSFSSYLKTQHWRSLSQYCFVCGFSVYPAPIDALHKNLRKVIFFSCHSIGPACKMMHPIVLPCDMQQLEINYCSNITSLADLLPGYEKKIVEFLMRCQRRSEESVILKQVPFANLQSLTIMSCPRLKHLLTSDLVEHLLRNLQKLRVCDCSNLEILIETEDVSSDSSHNSKNYEVFPKLQHLELCNLPNLKSLCRRNVVCKSLEEIEVVSCPTLRRLPLFGREEGGQTSITATPAIKKIRGQKEWWDLLEWDHPDSKNVMQSVFCIDSEE